ncbi:MAG: ferritin-like domain-containing protein [Candidatus Zixiibacteriota bacterium]|nr:MAG: ferritin-like domain-containing protein [candidate division Zixibacteria bacterium]
MTPVSSKTLEALATGITAEVAAYVFYVAAAGKAAVELHREILERMAGEEKSHFQILERQHDSLIRSEKWVSTADVLKQPGLPEISEDMMAAHQALIGEVEECKTALEILRIAYRLEEQAYETYLGASERISSEEGRAVFTRLARFEQGHMKMVKELMAKYK